MMQPMRAHEFLAVALPLLLLASACDDDPMVYDLGPKACDAEPGPTVASDIDTTLTINDTESTQQYVSGGKDAHPQARAGAAEMLQAWSERGYWIMYVTARPDAEHIPASCTTADCPSYFDATLEWLKSEGFPTRRAVLSLAEALSLDSNVTRDSKIARMQELTDEGYDFQYGYGDKLSDVDAFRALGIPDEHIFTVGPEPGMDGTVAIDEGADPEAASYAEHKAAFVEEQEQLCAPPEDAPEIEPRGVADGGAGAGDGGAGGG